ncbi:hypothetical protein ANN_15758 [Periplaneta americana]|uniref:Per a allergen n=1 Tax=Periplaneta americana TaxID=6978 RepID=A0ABQ8SJ26_PERAM|nr:hypothetical protein ANN_15758 [Periplaneta americana]
MRSLYISRPIDKKIVFFTNKAAALPVYDEFQKLWRSVVVESTDNLKIEEYLEKQGIHSMEDHRRRHSTSAKDIKVLETEFNSEFVLRIIPKLDWETFWNAADSIGHSGDLPQTLSDDYENDILNS